MSGTALPRSVVREVTHDLEQAEADKIVKVVAILDQMHERGPADDVLVPLRHRLARLRPRRPLRFARLLFQPLDALIVPAPQWRRGCPAIPRSVIQPVAALLHAALGPEAAAIDAQIEGHAATETKIVAAAGARLWPRAAQFLAIATPPPGWTDATGLQDADFTVLSRQIAAALECAGRMTSTETAAGSVVGDIVNRQPQALATVMTMLMAQTPDPQQLLRTVEPHVAPPQMTSVRVAMDNAYDFLVASASDAPPLPADLAVAEQDLRRVVHLLQSHERRSGQTAERSARVNELARRMSREARTRFDTALTTQVLLPMRSAAALNDDDVATVEALARDLRRFEGTARNLGAREHYDRQLRQSAEALRPAATDSTQHRADKLRMVEILAGPELALSMLLGQQASAP